MRKLGYLLQYGVLNGYWLKCYEIHIDFELAFFKDFDLSGFDEIKVRHLFDKKEIYLDN